MAITYHDPSAELAARHAAELPNIPRGLPAPLPHGEAVAWQGSPRWTDFAIQVFHVRAIAAYFALIAAWQAWAAIDAGGDWGDASGRVLVLAAAGAVTLGILCFLAWLVERTTVYTLTNKRLVMRIGIALPKTLDIPFGIVEGVSLVETRGGRGNIALDLGQHSKIAYALLWPHARPWHVREPQPLLRAVPDAANVAYRLAKGLTNSRSVAEETTPPPEDRFTEVEEHANLAPRKLVIAMAALALFTLVLASIGTMQGDGKIGPNYGAALRQVPISFVSTGAQSFDLLDEAGTVVASVAPGREGLLRNARRAFEVRRSRNGIDVALPYALTVWEGGELTLFDEHTGQNVRLDFFGQPPAGPLATLHDLARP